MKLYHIHRDNKYNDLYFEGNTFKVGDKPNNLRENFLNDSLTYLDYSEEIDGRTYDYYEDITKLLNIETISKMNDEEKKEFVSMMYKMIHNTKNDFRELILEDVRIRNFNDKPSRNSCMWLTDEDCLPYWIKQLDYKEIGIYEMNVDGNLFVSTDNLLPKGHLPRDIIYEKAFNYWNVKEKDIANSKDKEYLFEGEVKVLKKIQ